MEQQHWYEDLQLPLEATAVRCCACRKCMQFIGRQRKRHAALLHLTTRTPAQTLELVACYLTLLEQGIFHRRQCQTVRMLLKRLPETSRTQADYLQLRARLQEVVQSGAAHKD